MSVRYFRTLHGVAQYGNLTDAGAQVLADAGHEEITAEEFQAVQAEQAEQATVAVALLTPSTEQTKERASGRNKR